MHCNVTAAIGQFSTSVNCNFAKPIKVSGWKPTTLNVSNMCPLTLIGEKNGKKKFSQRNTRVRVSLDTTLFNAKKLKPRHNSLLSRLRNDRGVNARSFCRVKSVSEASLELKPGPVSEQARSLPIGEVLPEVLSALEEGKNVILEAPPGAGKTTCLPLAMLDNSTWLEPKSKILMLEPRRLAARAAASRMAQTLGESGPGGRVGYRVRGDSRVGRNTQVEVLTDGVLLRRLQTDPDLEGVACVVLDEFHERSIEVDTALAMCLEVQALFRPELRIVCMSATLGPTLTSTLTSVMTHQPSEDFEGKECSVIRSQGKSFPLSINFLGEPARGVRGEMQAAAASAVREALVENATGNVLCFLPGAGEIRAVERLLQDLKADVLPLHGSLPFEVQDRALQRNGSDQRKVVLATPVAESSLTIPGVRIVVDTGLARRPVTDAHSGLSRLHVTPVSQASATQRAGRAAREGPGVVYRLWSSANHSGRAESAPADIMQADLASTALALAAWGVTRDEVQGMRWVDPPPIERLDGAYEVLQGLGAVDPEGRPTDRGRQLAALPLHPRLGHLVIRGWELGYTTLACELAALVEERDLLQGRGKGSDITLRLEALRNPARSQLPVNREGRRRVQQQVERLLSIVRNMADNIGQEGAKQGGLDSEDRAIGVLLALAYPDRVAQRRGGAGSGKGRGGLPGETSSFLLSCGRGVTFPQRAEDPLASQEYLVVVEVGGSNKVTGFRGAKGGGSVRNDIVFLAAHVDIQDITDFVEGAVTTEETVFWADGQKSVLARQSIKLGSLILQQTPLDSPSGVLVDDCLLEAIKSKGIHSLVTPLTKPRCLAWRARVCWLRKLVEDSSLPDMSDEALLQSMDEWLRPLLGDGKVRSKSQLTKLDLFSTVKNLLTWEQQSMIEKWAPEYVEVPSGRNAKINYDNLAEDQSPYIEVKLQEMFGLSSLPSLARGKAALQCRLLSPAGRPTAVTQDLATFWEQGYPQVRKDLAGRYPKHAWPENPLEAAAPPNRSTLKPKVAKVDKRKKGKGKKK